MEHTIKAGKAIEWLWATIGISVTVTVFALTKFETKEDSISRNVDLRLQYERDQSKIERHLEKMDLKLDRLIEEKRKK